MSVLSECPFQNPEIANHPDADQKINFNPLGDAYGERAATRNVAAAENGLLCLSTYTPNLTDPHTQSLRYINVLSYIVLNCSVNLVFTGVTAIRTFPARVLSL